MAQYDFDVSQAPAGVCPPKLAREIKAAVGLGRKPKIRYRGTNFPGTDNLQSGVFTVITLRVLTDPEQATMLAAVQAHVICPPNQGDDKDDFGYELDDLEDLYQNAMPGQIVYVRDLPRINGESATKGTLVYRSRNGWRRVSNDQVVNP